MDNNQALLKVETLCLFTLKNKHNNNAIFAIFSTQ